MRPETEIVEMCGGPFDGVEVFSHPLMNREFFMETAINGKLTRHWYRYESGGARFLRSEGMESPPTSPPTLARKWLKWLGLS